MQSPSVAESRLLKACLGSHEPYDRVWANGSALAAVSDQLICILDNASSWEGGVLGAPYTDFIRLSEGNLTVEPHETSVVLHRGKIKLSMPLSPTSEFAWPAFPRTYQRFSAPVSVVKQMAAAVAANGEGGLQVTRFEMLGLAIHQGLGYSLSMEALICLKHKFEESVSVLLTTPYLKQLSSVLNDQGLKDEEVVTFNFTDKMVWTTLGRCRLAGAIPVIASWLNHSQVTQSLEGAATVLKDLSSLQADLGLLQALGPTIKLSKTGLRCGGAQAWYESEDLSLPSDCELSVARLASVLPLSPTLTRVATSIVELTGENFTSFLATAGS